MSTNERDLIVGGQAVIEGVMMRTPNAYAIAVRKADGTIVNTAALLPKWSDKVPILKLPILRGGAVLIQSMGLGIKALNYSANEAFVEAEAAEAAEVEVALTPAVVEGEGDFAGITGGVPGLFPIPTKKRSKDELKKGGTAAAAGSIVFAMIFQVLLFIALPLLLTTRFSLRPVGPRALRRSLQLLRKRQPRQAQPTDLAKSRPPWMSRGIAPPGTQCEVICIRCVLQSHSIWSTV